MSTGLCLTFDGLRALLSDLRGQGVKPVAILVSPHEKRDLKEELLASATELAPDAYEPNHDEKVIGWVEGCMILSHEHVGRGTCRILTAENLQDRNRDLIAR